MTLDISQQFPPSDLHDGLPLDLGRPVTGSPFVALAFLASALLRRKRLVAAVGAAGVSLAALFSMLAPPPHTATTTILLVHGSEAVPARVMPTDLGLLKTTTVAQQALKVLPERSSPQALLAAYTGVPVSEDLLRVTAEGSSGAQAVRRADAVARAFIDFRGQEFQRQARLATRSMAERQGLLTTELTNVNNQINSAPTDQRSEAAIRAFGDLLTRRTSLNDQITSLQQQIDLQNRDAQAIVDQTRIVDPASPDPRATRRTIVGNFAAGLIGGLALGIGFVIIQTITSDRLRRRDEVSAALGAPVEVSVGRLRGGGRRGHRRLIAHLAHPDADLARIERHLGSCLESAGSVRPAMLLLSLDTDVPAATAAAATAARLARQGSKVLVVDLTLHSTLGAVLEVPSVGAASVRLGIDAPPFTVAFAPAEAVSEGLRLDQMRASSDVVLLLGRLDPGLGAIPLIEWATSAVVFVTCGRSTVTAMRSASHLLRLAGLSFESIVMVGADANDHSIGLFDRPMPGPFSGMASARTSR